jgi:glycosyltransferase involved in cell wall biosynthesis
MVSRPKISVVMPAYNAAAYLDEAIRSILNQTFRDFEFIIINDGSSDDSSPILGKYESLDSRIQVYHQENQGMIAALNRGCRLARGEYIARMDADDISLPRRLDTQLKYIEGHPRIGILGTWIYSIDKSGSKKAPWRPSTNPKMLKWTHFYGVCVCHPSVLMRREVVERLDFYRPEAIHGEDVDLWLRASSITDFGNVPEILYEYRVWNGSSSHAGSELRKPAHAQLLVSFIEEFLEHEPSMDAVVGLRQTRVGPPFQNLRQIRQTAALIRELYKKFIRENVLTGYERTEISWDAAKKLASLALQALQFDLWTTVLLLMQALQLDYRLLYPSAIMKGLQRAHAINLRRNQCAT